MSYFENSIRDYDDFKCEEEIPFYYDDKYLYDYNWYHEKFPEEWVYTHKEGTGPGQCMNCLDYGCINEIFIGYCVNCALYDYEGTRGRGFINQGIEIDNEDEEAKGYESVFDTYLQGIDINAIEPIVKINKKLEYNEEDYLNGEPYDDINLDRNVDDSIMKSDFEGGYNDL